eukprot:g13917.t1
MRKVKDKDKDKDKSRKIGSTSVDKKNSSFFCDDDKLGAAAAAAAAQPSMLPPPPPPTASSTAPHLAAENSQFVATLRQPQQDEGGDGSDWYLCHDEDGNAYYYSETTGESVWAEVGEGGTDTGKVAAQEDIPAPNPSTAAEGRHNQHQPPPDGWSFHHDLETGHGYYLHDASATSVWAGTDGSFPGVGGDATVAAAHGEDKTVGASEGEGRGIGVDGEGGVTGDDACADWDAGIFFMAAAGERPMPTAPPPFSSTLEMAERQAGPGAGDGANEGEEEEEEQDTSMLLCIQGVMSTNDFFAARQLQIHPSCGGGSPMASAPPAAESGGRRSSCSPLPTSRAGDANKMWPTSPTAPSAAEHDGESAPGITEGSSGDHCRRQGGVQERSGNGAENGGENGDGAESSRGESPRRSFVYPAVPRPFESGTTPSKRGGQEEAREGGHHVPEAPPLAAAVRVGVWDTATATPSNSDNPSDGSGGGSSSSSGSGSGSGSQSNHFNMSLSGYARSTTANPTATAQNQRMPQQSRRETGSPSRHCNGGQEFRSGDPPATPSAHDSLLEKPGTPGFPTAAAGAIGGGDDGAPGGGLYPKLVDRNRDGISGGFSDDSGGENGVQGEGEAANVGKTSDLRPGTTTTSTDEWDGALANGVEKLLSLGDNGPRRMRGGEGE